MKKITLCAALSVSTLAFAATTARADYTLNILHINDWHSRIESINKYDSTCRAKDEDEGKCFGGAARLVTAVDNARKRAESGNTVLLNAGDNFQGTLFYTTYKGAAEAEFLNLMKTDAMAVGNHEFDDGEEGLATFLEKAEFPVLSANVVASHSSKLGDRVKPSVVLNVGGEKIGVVGAVANDTVDLSSPGDHVLIADDVKSIAAAVEALSAEGVSKVIALTHVGYPRDLAAIAKIPGVDIVVGGHSNTLLSNDNDRAAGPYPTWVENPGGYQVPVVQAYAYSKYLGDLTVTFDDTGKVIGASGEPILLDASVERNQAVLDRIVELNKPIEELKNKRVSETAEAIDGNRDNCRARECQMGNLVADAMLDRVKGQGIQVAIQNGGGLRASIDAGDITMGEVLTVLPFQNTLSTFELSGADIVASLESGVSQIEEGKGRFPQVAGLKYSFDPNVAPNEGRISNVEVNEGGAWAPVDPAKMYGVVSNNFMRSGGDGYKLFASNAQNAYDFGPGLELVVAEYLTNNQPYQPYLDGRITEAAATMEKAGDAEMEKEAEVAVVTPELPDTSNTLTTEPPKVDSAPAEAEVKMEAKVGDPADEDESVNEKIHTIVRGDNYWNLAKSYYGDARMWRMIAKANPEMRPRRLKIGVELTIPSAN